VLQIVAYQPPVHRIGGDEADQQCHRHDEPERRCCRIGAPPELHLQDHHRGHHAGHQQVHRQQFRDEGAGDRAGVGAAEHVAHEQRLEHHPAERKTKGVFESDLAQAGEAKNVREHSAGEDTDAVASDAMHGRSQGLAPTRRDVLLVQSG